MTRLTVVRMLKSTPCFCKRRKPAHHFVERSGAALVDAVGVVQFARAVEAQPDEVVVLLEELAPLVVQQRSVRLHGVLERHAGLLVLFLDSDGAPEEVDAHDGRLATLPSDGDLATPMRLDQLAM